MCSRFSEFWHSWVDQNPTKKNLAKSPFYKLYNVHNVDMWWWENYIYSFLPKKIPYVICAFVGASDLYNSKKIKVKTPFF
jgi:hypothetical protein